jgi:hypothetical protein
MALALSILALAVGLLGLCFGVISLVYLWARKDEHPDVTKLRAEIMDVYDKVDHWMKRDAVRRARAKREGEPEDVEPAAAPAVAMTTAEWKAQARRALFAKGQ